MYSLTQYGRIVASWLASFARSEWRPEHYPIEVRRQKDVPPEAAWYARVLNWPGPAGFGPAEADARKALLKDLGEIARVRLESGQSMPRPGTGLPIQFASTARVGALSALLEDFVVHVLGFRPDDPVFISDESSISDFGNDERVGEIRQRIAARYAIVITEPEPVFIADILERIHAQGRPNPTIQPPGDETARG